MKDFINDEIKSFINKTITNKELIKLLQKCDPNKPVIISCVGVGMNDSFDVPINFEEDSVEEFKDFIRIHYS